MLEISGFGVGAAILSVALAVGSRAFSAVCTRVAARAAAPSLSTVRGRGGVSVAMGRPPSTALISSSPGGAVSSLLTAGLASRLSDYATGAAGLGFLLLSVALAARTLATGHGPFANFYEFSLAFAWGVLGASLVAAHRYRERTLGLIAWPIALALLSYAATLPSAAAPLVPALQNNVLLTIHVACAVVAYGTFAVAFAAAVLYLARSADAIDARLTRDGLDEISYRAVVIGFPFLTLTIVLGAVWADIAWGSYWSWDPKETASLVTWLIFGAYLHARVIRGWEGRRAAGLLIVGFLAILFTFLGSLFFGGIHSYSGVT